MPALGETTFTVLLPAKRVVLSTRSDISPILVFLLAPPCSIKIRSFLAGVPEDKELTSTPAVALMVRVP